MRSQTFRDSPVKHRRDQLRVTLISKDRRLLCCDRVCFHFLDACIGLLTQQNEASHTRTLVRDCFNGDEASQWKRQKFDTSSQHNPLTDLHEKWHACLRYRLHPTCKNLWRPAKRFLLPKKRNFEVLQGLIFVTLLGVLQLATAYSLNGFLRKIRQKTSFPVRKCILGSR